MRHATPPAGREPTDPLTLNLLAGLATRDLSRLRHYWYLAEWKHAITTGQPITQQAFRRNLTGPIEQIIEAALENGLPLPRLARTRLPKSARAAVAHVRRTCNPMRARELDFLVRCTYPYLTLNPGDLIDFPRQATAYREYLERTGLAAPGEARTLKVA